MKLIKLSWLFFFIVPFTILNLSAQNTIILNDSDKEFFLTRDYLYLFQDTTKSETILSLLKKENKNSLFNNEPNGPVYNTSSANTSYWFRATIKNQSKSNQHYILESFNYRIDSMS